MKAPKGNAIKRQVIDAACRRWIGAWIDPFPWLLAMVSLKSNGNLSQERRPRV